MESPHQARRLIGHLFVAGLFVILGWAALSQYTSPIVQKLAARANTSISLSLRTKPEMLVTYNPSTLKAQLTVEDITCNPKKKDCSTPKPPKFFIPKQTNRDLFWEQFKQNLVAWRYNPVLAAQTAWSYLTALHEKRTNLSPAEFILLALEIIKLEPSDFSVKFPPVPQKKKGQAKEPIPAIVPQIPSKPLRPSQDRPLILEIFNASGKRGIALELTQYLREKNQKGLLRVDVFNYENYPTLEQTSWVEDYSGRLADVKQLSHALGINAEIRTGTTPNVMCDTRIVIGKDFVMPL